MTDAITERMLLNQTSPAREGPERALTPLPTTFVEQEAWLAESALEPEAADCVVIFESPVTASGKPPITEDTNLH